MLEKIKVSLWDIAVYFLTGVLLIFTIMYFFPEKITVVKNNILLIEEESVRAVFYAVVTYAVGFMFEPFSNYFCRFFIDKSCLGKLYFGESKEKFEAEQNRYYELTKGIVDSKYSVLSDDVEYYQIAKTEVERSGTPNKFMTFLGNFGFYRNLSVIALVNLCLVIYSYILNRHSTIEFVFSIIILITSHIIFYRRGKEFYYYSGNEIYKNFIISNSKPKQNI